MKNIKGFTLIELLVVITIIGILAVGGIGVYNSQIEKARDTVRINDIKVIQSAAEQAYQDGGFYVSTDVGEEFKKYTQQLPQDPKSGQSISSGSEESVFDYYYFVAPGVVSGVEWQSYEVSDTLENQANREKKAADDGGDDNLRLEVGNAVNDVQATCDSDKCTLWGADESAFKVTKEGVNLSE